MNMSSQEDLKIVNAKLRAELEKDKPRISKAADYAKRAQALLRRVTDELSDEIAECDDDAARSAMQDSLDEAHQVTTQLCKRASATVEAHRQKQLQEDNRADDEHVVANTDVEVHAVSESASADTAPMQASASATDDLAKMKRGRKARNVSHYIIFKNSHIRGATTWKGTQSTNKKKKRT